MKAIILIVLLMSSASFGYEVVVYTDQPGGAHALEAAEEMRRTYPFSALDMNIVVVVVAPEQLGCRAVGLGSGTQRIQCNNNNINAIAAHRGADQAIVVSNINNPDLRGGASLNGVAATSVGRNKREMIHEFMHTLGICDTYPYPPHLAPSFCNPNSVNAQINVALINPQNPYGSDVMARTNHSSAIPWYSNILPTTPITHNDGTLLGTPVGPSSRNIPPNNSTSPAELIEPIGLYHSSMCYRMPAGSPYRDAWVPGAGRNVMDSLDNGLGRDLEELVKQALISRGARSLEPQIIGTSTPILPVPALNPNGESISR